MDLEACNKRLEGASAQEILQWSWEKFQPHIAASSSFQTQSIPLLHLISCVCPKLPVIFLDTGFHFPETLAFRDKVQSQLGLNLRVVQPSVDQAQLFNKHGQGLYRLDPDLCCYINKVEPMKRATANLKAWISGIRRDQTTQRKRIQVLEDQTVGLIKIHPMLNWTSRDVRRYLKQHDLPQHPLYSKGYLSIGCAPCTQPVHSGQDERAGRWATLNKTECGLHADTKEQKRGKRKR